MTVRSRFFQLGCNWFLIIGQRSTRIQRKRDPKMSEQWCCPTCITMYTWCVNEHNINDIVHSKLRHQFCWTTGKGFQPCSHGIHHLPKELCPTQIQWKDPLTLSATKSTNLQMEFGSQNWLSVFPKKWSVSFPADFVSWRVGQIESYFTNTSVEHFWSILEIWF